MTKTLIATILVVLTLTMLLPVAGSVNAHQLVLRQGTPFPPNGGGHVMLRQGTPFPPNGGGHVMLRQGTPFPPNGGGH